MSAYIRKSKLILFIITGLLYIQTNAQKLVPVAKAWAHNSVNTVIFRKNSLTTFRRWQYIAFYDEQQNVVVGKRKIRSTKWLLHKTKFKGNASDAHRCISIAVDGDGYLHLAWDEHDNKLNYAKSVASNSLTFSDKTSMSGSLEQRITYPEFYRLSNGDLLFLYRNGVSGEGNLVINKYDLKNKKWIQLHSDLIDGEGARSAYWQCCVDKTGNIHLSWVWRESPDVASNHDMCYAVSKDGGISWERSNGGKYYLPITAATAEYACRIPQHSELINQTSMTADDKGDPYIATYWRDKNDSAPQYHVVFLNNGKWQTQTLALRYSNFSLSGAGTKRVPISRPQIVCEEKHGRTMVAIMYRDEERKNKISLAINNNVTNSNRWIIKDIYDKPVDSWEPTFDIDLWKQKRRLDIFVQKTDQADAEGVSAMLPQMVYVLESEL